MGSSDGGRIEIGHVLDYCTLYQIQSELARDELLRICRYLSDEFQEIRAKRMKQAQEQASRKSARGAQQPWKTPIPRGS